MDFMKALDQTVREIKREVNLKVLKVPEIEQKVLDATSDEPWGPHGSALLEIAQATKELIDCHLILIALWKRLSDTGSKWRHVYKSLTVIEYLIANGSEHAVDDIVEQTIKISALSGFEYVEPNGKDVGINVRKKVETILVLLNDKEKIQAVREKASATRDKYFGLSSTGITYKSSATSYSSGGFSDRHGSLSGLRDGDTFRDSYRDSQSYKSVANENEGNKSKKSGTHQVRDQDSLPSNSKSSTKPGLTPPPKSASVQASSSEDDFDDFDPRGSSKTGSANTSSSQVDLFGQNLVGNLLDEPVPVTTATTSHSDTATTEDLFADATFQSASPQAGATASSDSQESTDLFASQPAIPAAFPSNNMDFFAVPDRGLPSETKSPFSEPAGTKTFDPFATIPLNNFESSDTFGVFTSHSEPATTKPSQHSTTSSLNKLDGTFGAFTSHTETATTESSRHSANNSFNHLDQTYLTASKPALTKDTFQVKSGIWADSLSRGLIDLNITAPKKVNLADIGIVGGLSDGSDVKERGPPTSAYRGGATGTGIGLGRSGFPSSTAMGGSGNVSTLGQQQFGSFK